MDLPPGTLAALREETGPALPGALSWGDTVEEAMANITEAIEGLLGAMREDDGEIPIERPHTVVTTVTVHIPELAAVAT